MDARYGGRHDRTRSSAPGRRRWCSCADHDRIIGALRRAECDVEADLLDGAHYRGGARFTTDSMSSGLGRVLALVPRGLRRASAALRTMPCEESTAPRQRVRRRGCGVRVIPGVSGRAGELVTPACGSACLRRRRPIGERPARRSRSPGRAGRRRPRSSAVIDSGEVGVMKPDPRIFKLALDAMGVRPERTWYVGDMPRSNVVGARRGRAARGAHGSFGFPPRRDLRPRRLPGPTSQPRVTAA